MRAPYIITYVLRKQIQLLGNRVTISDYKRYIHVVFEKFVCRDVQNSKGHQKRIDNSQYPLLKELNLFTVTYVLGNYCVENTELTKDNKAIICDANEKRKYLKQGRIVDINSLRFRFSEVRFTALRIFL